jgi:CcmD family protein
MRGLGFIFAACLSLGSLTAFAQTDSTTTAEPPPGFSRVKGAPDTEKVDASKLVVGAYAAFFLGMFLYVVHVARRQAEMAKEMKEIADRIRRADEK